MEIELLLPGKNHSYSKHDIETERLFTQKILPKLESFVSFIETHELIDTQKRKTVHRLPKLAEVYKSSACDPFNFIICKN